MPTGDLGLWVSLIEYIGGVFCVFIISDNPHGKDRAEFDFRLALGIFMLIVVGLILLYSTLDTLAYSESRSAIKLSPIALFVSGVAVVLSYHRLKRFEQEETLERLAEKMGEKLGESMAKGLKAKDS